jgi:uncharacterized protein YecE (DUF72 family)
MSGKIHIGTSGFSYKHWRGDFYPREVKPGEYLNYYAQHFHTTEINASFYKLPEEHTLQGWAAQVPKSFHFCPKMSRFLTHMKKLRDPEEPLSRFFNVFHTIKHQMGPVLFQLHDKLSFKPEVADHFYKTLCTNHPGYKAAIEIRHPSWLSEESISLLKQYHIGLVVNHSGVLFPYSETVTSKDMYIRLHGPRELYASAYGDQDLQYFADRIKSWSKDGLTVWAFFNNDIHGYAPRDAARLQSLLA